MKKTFIYFLILTAGIISYSSSAQAFIFGNKDEKVCEETYLSGDIEIAEISCTKAASKSTSAQFYLSNIYLKTNRISEGITILEKVAGNEYPEAALILGEYYEQLDNEESKIKSLFYFDFACKLNILKACERAHTIRTKQEKQDIEKSKSELTHKEFVEKEQELAKEKAQLQQEREEIQLRVEQERAEIEFQKLQNEALRTALEREKLTLNNSSKNDTSPKTDSSNNLTTGIKAIGPLTKIQYAGLWGYQDSIGNWIVKPKLRYAAGFYENLAAVQFPNGYWGFIDTNGQLIIPAQFCSVARFSNGLAGANVNGRIAADGNCNGGTWGYINSNGKFQIPPIYQWVGIFKNQRAEVKTQRASFTIDHTGQIINE